VVSGSTGNGVVRALPGEAHDSGCPRSCIVSAGLEAKYSAGITYSGRSESSGTARGMFVCWQVELDLQGGPHAPAAASGFVGTQLDAMLESSRRAEVLEAAGLVVSEIVGNAVRADSDRVHLALRLHQGELKIEITDGGWAAGDRTGSGDIRGRGLVLVDALAQAWGIKPIAGVGKQFWAMVAVPRELTPSLRCQYASGLGTD
jgi:hypothetical protein